MLHARNLDDLSYCESFVVMYIENKEKNRLRN